MHKTIRAGLLGVVWVGVLMVLAGFVLPWASLDLKSPIRQRTLADVGRVVNATPLADVFGKLTKKMGRVVVQVQRGAETVTGELPNLGDIPKEVRGVDIPALANQPNAHVLMALAEMLTGQRQLGAKSYAVYVLPGVALLCGLLLTIAPRMRELCLAVGLACQAVAGGGYWKVATANLDTLMVAITIGNGLWLSLWGYAMVGTSALGLALFGGRKTA